MEGELKAECFKGCGKVHFRERRSAELQHLGKKIVQAPETKEEQQKGLRRIEPLNHPDKQKPEAIHSKNLYFFFFQQSVLLFL